MRARPRLQARVDKIADGAALMTETSHTRKFIDGTADCLPNRTLRDPHAKTSPPSAYPRNTPEVRTSPKTHATALFNESQGRPSAGSAGSGPYKIRALQQTSGHAVDDFLLPYFTGEALRASSTDVGDND